MGLAKNLVKIGYRVTIITQFLKENDLRYDGSFIYDETDFNILRVEIGSSSKFFERARNKIANLLSPINRPREFRLAVLKYLETNPIPAIDVIFATFPDHANLSIGAELSKKLKKPWIADFRDCYQHDGSMAQNFLRPFRINAIKKIARTAVLATYVAPSLEKNVKNIMGHKKIVKLENAYDEDDHKHYHSPKKGSNLIFVYTGTLHLNNQTLIPLLDALLTIQDSVTVDLTLIRILVFGDIQNKVQANHKKHPLGHLIAFQGRVSRDISLKHQAEADVLLLGNGAGSKIYEYLFARKPILMMQTDHGYADHLLKETRVGWAPRNQHELNGIVQKILNDWSQSGKIDFNKDLNLTEYMYSKRAKELDRVIEDFV
ncbi:hypothetical protein N9D61_03345 [Planktomarina sp.]|nr:hypothetical protein [Planktomarina sp.]